MSTVRFIALILSGLAAAIPNLKWARVRADYRRCLEQQHEVSRAIKKWDLERECRLMDHASRGLWFPAGDFPPARCKVTHLETVQTPWIADFHYGAMVLERAGYLSKWLTDPGMGDSIAASYKLVPFGNGVLCPTHGSASLPSESPRQLLARHGLLTLSAYDSDWQESKSQRLRGEPLAFVVFFVIVLAPGFGTGSPRSSRDTIRKHQASPFGAA